MAKNIPSIIFLGSPLIDLIANIDDNFMKKYNLQIDCTYPAENLPNDIFDELNKYNPVIRVGGSITNTVRIFQRITDLPPKTAVFLGSIGKDLFGEKIKKEFQENNIDIYLEEIDNESTGKVAVLIKGTGRTLITDLGASRKFSMEYLNQDKIWKLIEESQYLYLSTLFIKVSIEVIRRIIDFFVEHNRIIFLNLGAPFILKQQPEEVTYMFQSSDFVIGNQNEFRAFAEAINIETNCKIEEIILGISKRFQNKDRRLLVTNGPNDIIVWSENGIERFKVKAVDNIVNTNGAGDAFVAGFMAGYILGKSFEESIQLGISTAVKCIQNKL